MRQREEPTDDQDLVSVSIAPAGPHAGGTPSAPKAKALPTRPGVWRLQGEPSAANGRPPLTRALIRTWLLAAIATPLLLLWWLLAVVAAIASAVLVLPSLCTSHCLYWSCPFAPHGWNTRPWATRWLEQLSFEAAYHINVVTRLLTLPMRPHLPDFYILGFPKCGTTSLASQLRRHPALAAVQGLPVHEALVKESHFFMGALGRRVVSSSLLYRSFFPTVMRQWWVQLVVRAEKLICFDACPTYACLPFVAGIVHKMTPQAKFIVMVRDPVQAIFSAEIMLRNLGVPLRWSFMQPVADAEAADLMQVDAAEARELWDCLEAMKPGDPLPPNFPRVFYFAALSYVKSGRYAQALRPFLAHFPRDRFIFVDFKDFVSNTEAAVKEVLQFVGADPDLWHYTQLPPGMKAQYHGREMHPTVTAALQRLLSASNQELYEIMGRDLQWGY